MTSRRRCLLLLAVTLPPLGLAACKHKEPPPPPPPPPPTVVSMALKAAADVNPDVSGAAKPVRLRVFQLTSPVKLAALPFFQIDKDPKAALGDTVKAVDEYVLRPGETQLWKAKLDDTVHFVGIMASYQDIEHAAWRAFKEVPRNATTLLDADVGATAVVIRDAGP